MKTYKIGNGILIVLAIILQILWLAPWIAEWHQAHLSPPNGIDYEYFQDVSSGAIKEVGRSGEEFLLFAPKNFSMANAVWKRSDQTVHTMPIAIGDSFCVQDNAGECEVTLSGLQATKRIGSFRLKYLGQNKELNMSLHEDHKIPATRRSGVGWSVHTNDSIFIYSDMYWDKNLLDWHRIFFGQCDSSKKDLLLSPFGRAASEKTYPNR